MSAESVCICVSPCWHRVNVARTELQIASNCSGLLHVNKFKLLPTEATHSFLSSCLVEPPSPASAKPWMCPSHNIHIFVSWISDSWLSLLFLSHQNMLQSQECRKVVTWNANSLVLNFFIKQFLKECCFPCLLALSHLWLLLQITQQFNRELPGVTGLLCLTSSLLDLCASEACLDVSKCGLSWSSAAVQALVSSTAWCWTPWWLNLQGISVSCTLFSELCVPGFADNCTNQQRLEEIGKTLKEDKQKTSGAEILLFSQQELLQEFGWKQKILFPFLFPCYSRVWFRGLWGSWDPSGWYSGFSSGT